MQGKQAGLPQYMQKHVFLQGRAVRQQQEVSNSSGGAVGRGGPMRKKVHALNLALTWF